MELPVSPEGAQRVLDIATMDLFREVSQSAADVGLVLVFSLEDPAELIEAGYSLGDFIMPVHERLTAMSAQVALEFEVED